MSETKLSREEVLKIARLARLQLTDEEVELYQVRLGRVLDYVRELREVKTPKESFVRHVPRDAVTQREDQPIAFGDAKAILENAPVRSEDSFVLPAIMEES